MEDYSFQFIEFAKAEYDALYRYCNAIARISHVVVKGSVKSSQHTVDTDSSRSFSGKKKKFETLDLSTLLAHGYLVSRRLDSLDLHEQNKEESIEATVVDYYEALQDLRNSHSLLLDFVSNQRPEDTQSSLVIGKPIMEWMMEHLQLSSRIITTCASSSTSAGFGPFYENGLARDLGGKDDVTNQSWHHVRIISLATLQANITRIRKNIQEIFGQTS